MSIPLDRLYHFIEKTARKVHDDNVLIYRFWPNGSKNINNLLVLQPHAKWVERVTSLAVWCNDQEPLDYEYYSRNLKTGELKLNRFDFLDLDHVTNLNYQHTIFEKNILLHSEKRSPDVQKYHSHNELIPVYYWSHALISRDWFRYAQHESFTKCSKKTFLIYNRAWSGTREYRLKFSDLLIDNGILDQCQTWCNAIDPDTNLHYAQYEFVQEWCKPKNNLEKFLPVSQATGVYSADFDSRDYDVTDIEVVLETLFCDQRLHLTEKTLRPIACGQPFVLAATHGSLAYLKDYGFQTFDSVWDESYDGIQDPQTRLQAVIDLMKHISGWDSNTRTTRLTQAQKIADHNRRWFFSQEFSDRIVQELETNLESALEEIKKCNNFRPWIDRWTGYLQHRPVLDFLQTVEDTDFPSKSGIDYAIKITKQNLDKQTKNQIQ